MARKGNPISVRLDLNRSSDSSRFSENDLKLLFCIGIAILTSFLALAGAAWSLDLPDFLSSALFSVIYYSLVYIFLYIDMKCSVYARTIAFFHDFMVKEKESIDFFHKLGFLFSCFLFFLYSYNYFLSFDDDDENLNLVNPLQVVAQLCCFFFYFQSKRSDVRERHLILLCFILSIMGTLYLKGINFGFYFYIISLLSILIYIKDFDYVPLVVLLFYSLDVGLAKWGFYLLFQQVAYYALSISLDKDQSIPPNRVIFIKILVLTIQLLIGTLVYQDFYLKEPAKLAVLLSGASIIFVCMKKRSRFAFLLSFFIYFIMSIMIGLVSLPGKVTALDLWGFSIFVLGHIIFLWGLQLFILPHEKQAIVPFLFYTLFYLLPYFPHLKWISKWIEGFDLLLFLLSLLLFIEESRASHGRRTINNTKDPPPNEKKEKTF